MSTSLITNVIVSALLVSIIILNDKVWYVAALGITVLIYPHTISSRHSNNELLESRTRFSRLNDSFVLICILACSGEVSSLIIK